VLVSSSSLLIRGILAALRQKFHLSTCPNLASHLCARTWRAPIGSKLPRSLSIIAKYRTPSIDTLKRGLQLQDYLANSQSGSLATDAQRALDDLDAQIAVVDSAPARLQYFASDTEGWEGCEKTSAISPSNG
jgi:hypothetical protein